MINAKYTEKNFLKYGKQYEWSLTFHAAGLDHLEDPENEFNVADLEEWLSNALVHRGMEKSAALEAIRQQGKKVCS